MLQLLVSLLISFSFLLELLSFLYEIFTHPSALMVGNRKRWKKKQSIRAAIVVVLYYILIITLLLLFQSHCECVSAFSSNQFHYFTPVYYMVGVLMTNHVLHMFSLSSIHNAQCQIFCCIVLERKKKYTIHSALLTVFVCSQLSLSLSLKFTDDISMHGKLKE